MNSRPSFATRSSAGRRHSPAPSSIAPTTVSTRSSTPTRFNSHHKRQQQQMPPAKQHVDTHSGSSTPNGRHRNHGRKRGESRKPQQQLPDSPKTPSDSDPDTHDVDTEEDSEELFQLLGVNGEDNGDAVSSGPATEKGLLRLSKENMEAALANNASKKKRVRTKNKPRGDTPVDQKDETSVASDHMTPARDQSPTPGTRRKRGKGLNKLAAVSRDASPGVQELDAMSRSLPASFFTEGKKNEAGGAPKAWDMPTDAPAGAAQALNWQQQLQAETASPRRSSRSNPSEGRRRTKQSPEQTRNHDRHQSLDQVPVSNLTKMMANVALPSGGARPPASAFDSSIPFHTGYNVHRAPQTPVRAVARAAPLSGAMSLPIVGDFPRINKSGAPLGGPKYAGPTFHNSPASGSLPQPDLDDF